MLRVASDKRDTVNSSSLVADVAAAAEFSTAVVVLFDNEPEGWRRTRLNCAPISNLYIIYNDSVCRAASIQFNLRRLFVRRRLTIPNDADDVRPRAHRPYFPNTAAKK